MKSGPQNPSINHSKKSSLYVYYGHIPSIYQSKIVIIVASGIKCTSDNTKKPYHGPNTSFFIYQNKENLIRHFQSKSNIWVIFVYQTYNKHTELYTEFKFEKLKTKLYIWGASDKNSKNQEIRWYS